MLHAIICLLRASSAAGLDLLGAVELSLFQNHKPFFVSKPWKCSRPGLARSGGAAQQLGRELANAAAWDAGIWLPIGLSHHRGMQVPNTQVLFGTDKMQARYTRQSTSTPERPQYPNKAPVPQQGISRHKASVNTRHQYKTSALCTCRPVVPFGWIGLL